jgi:hypothetical protein
MRTLNNGAPRVNPWSHSVTRLRLRLRRGYPPQLEYDIAAAMAGGVGGGL